MFRSWSLPSSSSTVKTFSLLVSHFKTSFFFFFEIIILIILFYLFVIRFGFWLYICEPEVLSHPFPATVKNMEPERKAIFFCFWKNISSLSRFWIVGFKKYLGFEFLQASLICNNEVKKATSISTRTRHIKSYPLLISMNLLLKQWSYKSNSYNISRVNDQFSTWGLFWVN